MTLTGRIAITTATAIITATATTAGIGMTDVGAAVVLGIVGLAAGAIIAGQGHGGSSYHAICARKYRSYDPRSGTYLGYDGYRHRCRY
jgi:hypothetical protein